MEVDPAVLSLNCVLYPLPVDHDRWIGRGGTINWPPRSPDLTPLDFCLWGLMKSEVYRKKWIHETNCSLTYWMLSPA